MAMDCRTGSWWRSSATFPAWWSRSMARKRTRSAPPALDPAAASFAEATQRLKGHPMFLPLLWRVGIRREEGNLCPPDGWALVTTNGQIHVHPHRRAEPDEWVYVLAHCLLHLGMGHIE